MTSCRKFLEQLKIRHICSNKYIQRRQTLINALRPLARDESAVFLLYLPTVYLFLSRLFALTKQLRPSLYLPVDDYSPGAFSRRNGRSGGCFLPVFGLKMHFF